MTGFVIACGVFMIASATCAALFGLGFLGRPTMVWVLAAAHYSFMLQSLSRVLAFSLKPPDKGAGAPRVRAPRESALESTTVPQSGIELHSRFGSSNAGP